MGGRGLLNLSVRSFYHFFYAFLDPALESDGRGIINKTSGVHRVEPL